jgi:hypothetical protein
MCVSAIPKAANTARSSKLLPSGMRRIFVATPASDMTYRPHPPSWQSQ